MDAEGWLSVPTASRYLPHRHMDLSRAMLGRSPTPLPFRSHNPPRNEVFPIFILSSRTIGKIINLLWYHIGANKLRMFGDVQMYCHSVMGQWVRNDERMSKFQVFPSSSSRYYITKDARRRVRLSFSPNERYAICLTLFCGERQCGLTIRAEGSTSYKPVATPVRITRYEIATFLGLADRKRI